MSDKLHIRDSTRNVHGDMYPTACGARVIREHLAIKKPATCRECTLGHEHSWLPAEEFINSHRLTCSVCGKETIGTWSVILDAADTNP